MGDIHSSILHTEENAETLIKYVEIHFKDILDVMVMVGE